MKEINHITDYEAAIKIGIGVLLETESFGMSFMKAGKDHIQNVLIISTSHYLN